MNIEELKAIVAGKPKDATKFDGEYWDIRTSNDHHRVYIENEHDGLCWHSTDDDPCIYNIRSLSDIETIISQADEIADLNTCFDTCYDELTATRDANDELEAQVSELQDFAIWMTGCGYDFTQHTFFNTQRDKLLLAKGESK